jgi:hypothetical protein
MNYFALNDREADCDWGSLLVERNTLSFALDDRQRLCDDPIEETLCRRVYVR